MKDWYGGLKEVGGNVDSGVEGSTDEKKDDEEEAVEEGEKDGELLGEVGAALPVVVIPQLRTWGKCCPTVADCKRLMRRCLATWSSGQKSWKKFGSLSKTCAYQHFTISIILHEKL